MTDTKVHAAAHPPETRPTLVSVGDVNCAPPADQRYLSTLQGGVFRGLDF